MQRCTPFVCDITNGFGHVENIIPLCACILQSSRVFSFTDMGKWSCMSENGWAEDRLPALFLSHFCSTIHSHCHCSLQYFLHSLFPDHITYSFCLLSLWCPLNLLAVSLCNSSASAVFASMWGESETQMSGKALHNSPCWDISRWLYNPQRVYALTIRTWEWVFVGLHCGYGAEQTSNHSHALIVKS